MNEPLDDRLALLAEQAGIDVNWRDALDRPQSTPARTVRAVLQALGLPADNADDVEASLRRIEEERSGRQPPRLLTAEAGGQVELPAAARGRSWKIVTDEGGRISEGALPSGERLVDAPAVPGYYTLLIDEEPITLAVAPPRAFGIGDIASAHRPWGIAVQMSSLRRPGDGGIGDFTALELCAKAAAEKGADALAISPLHALFAAAPERYSPYAPSSRLFLNGLYIDPARTSGEQTVRAVIDTHNLRQELAELEWPRVDRLAARRACADDDPPFRVRVGVGGYRARGAIRRVPARARRTARAPRTFRSIACRLHRAWARGGWQGWPEAFHDPAGLEVAAFAREHAREVSFHAWLQWLATQGLEGAQKAARDAGMAIGLVADLAVGADAGGSHAWAHQKEVLNGLSVGAPPDALNRLGQDWGSPRSRRVACARPASRDSSACCAPRWPMPVACVSTTCWD